MPTAAHASAPEPPARPLDSSVSEPWEDAEPDALNPDGADPLSLETSAEAADVPAPEFPPPADQTAFPPPAPPTWDALPGLWPALVQRYAADKPLTASPLYHSRLRLRAGDPPDLAIDFADAPQRDLFLADGENKRALQVFLAGEVGAAAAFTLSFDVDPEAATHDAAATAPDGLESLLRREPILQTLIELFEGRVLGLF